MIAAAVLAVVTKRFELTNRQAEKRSERVVLLCTETEKAWMEAEAARRGTTVQNLMRMALALIQKKR